MAEAIQMAVAGPWARLVRPGARYVATADGGAWLANSAPLPTPAADRFTVREATLLLPLLRTVDRCAAGKGGRQRAPATSPDGRFIEAACATLGVTAKALAAAIGAHESALSRARSGTLRASHRTAIEALVAAIQHALAQDE